MIRTLLLVLGAALLAACSSTNQAAVGAGATTTSAAGPASSSPGTVSCTYTTGSTPAKPVDPPPMGAADRGLPPLMDAPGAYVMMS